VKTVTGYLSAHPNTSLKHIVFNVFKNVDKDIYQQLL